MHRVVFDCTYQLHLLDRVVCICNHFPKHIRRQIWCFFIFGVHLMKKYTSRNNKLSTTNQETVNAVTQLWFFSMLVRRFIEISRLARCASMPTGRGTASLTIRGFDKDFFCQIKNNHVQHSEMKRVSSKQERGVESFARIGGNNKGMIDVSILISRNQFHHEFKESLWANIIYRIVSISWKSNYSICGEILNHVLFLKSICGPDPFVFNDTRSSELQLKYQYSNKLFVIFFHANE